MIYAMICGEWPFTIRTTAAKQPPVWYESLGFGVSQESTPSEAVCHHSPHFPS